MKTITLLENRELHHKDSYAQPLFADKTGRVLRFILQPGQNIREHNTPDSPFYIVILQGQGMFAGGDGQEHQCGSNELLIFDPGENHAIRALDEELIFVGFLHGASNWT